MRFTIDLSADEIKALHSFNKEYKTRSGEDMNLESFIKMLIFKELPGNDADEIRYQINMRKKITANGEVIEIG